MTELQKRYSEYWDAWRSKEQRTLKLLHYLEHPPTDRLKRQLAGAIEVKDEGNKHFKACQYEAAIQKYHEAVQAMPEQEAYFFLNEDYMKFKLAVMNNVATCFMRLKNYNMVERQCREGLREFPNNMKPKYNPAFALAERGEEEEALPIFRQLQQALPNDEAVRTKKEALELTVKAYKESMKQMFGGKSPKKEEPPQPKPLQSTTTQSSSSILFWGGLAIGIASLVGFAAYKLRH